MYSEGLGSPDEEKSGSFTSGRFALKSPGSKIDEDAARRNSISQRSPSSVHGTHSSHALLPETSQGSKSILPPVQINSSFTSSPHSNASLPKPHPAAVVQNILSPTHNGRRKSTPAALDMALRTAEGRKAIEELINPGGQKPMVFAQYFGNGNQAAGKVDKPRFNKIQAAMAKYDGPAIDKTINTVPEDEDQMPAASPVTTPSSSSPASARPNKRPADSVSSFQEPEHKVVAPPPPPAVQPAPAPAPMPMEEEIPPGKRTRILAVCPTLPNGMARKYWCLADYTITRKMYTGYASTVYQVMPFLRDGMCAWATSSSNCTNGPSSYMCRQHASSPWSRLHSRCTIWKTFVS